MHVAASFTYPFRPGSLRVWAPGLLLIALLPVSFPLVFGYAVRAIRAVAADPGAPPPGLAPDRRLLGDGLAVSLAALLAAIPYAAAVTLLAAVLRARVPAGFDPFLASLETSLAAAIAVLIPWGTAVLVLAPPALAGFAATGRPSRLFDPRPALATVRRRFTTWNLASVAIVTAWTIALAGAGLLCVGFIPAALYAILVSAHATASLVEAAPAGPPPAPAG